jgi:plasmid replication initiation protein
MRRKQKETAGNQIKVIRKANELVEARYRFDIWEMRLFAKMLMTIRSEDKDLLKYDIHINEIIKDFNLLDAGDNYAAIKEAAQKLQTKIIEIEKETPDGVKWFRTPLLIGIEGFKNRLDGNYISVQFHPDLKPYLVELKERYLQYDIRNLWGLSSIYSVRMYELLKQYERIGKRFFEIENLRLILGIHPDEYKLYGHFKSKVILKAQSDMGEATDIAFTFEEKKDSRKVVGITFFIQKNDTTTLSNKRLPESAEKTKSKVDTNTEFFTETLNQVKQWGVTEKTLKKLLTDFDEDRVKNGLVCTLDNLNEGKIKDNVVGFFMKAVEENWQSTKQLKSVQQKERLKVAAEKRELAEQELSKWQSVLVDLQDARNFEVREVVRLLTQDDVLLAGEAVGKIIADKVTRNILEKKTGLKLDKLNMDDWRHNENLREAVIRQIEKMHPEEFSPIQGRFDEQIKQLRRKIETVKAEL